MYLVTQDGTHVSRIPTVCGGVYIYLVTHDSDRVIRIPTISRKFIFTS